MECNFCHQEVADPCRDKDMVHARAIEHVERCEDAENAEDGLPSTAEADIPGIITPVTHQ